MKNKSKNIVLFFLILPTIIIAQISPGDLTRSHSQYEGISNCTLCHDIGEKVSNTKCLDCHNEISDLLKLNRGYHANVSIIKKDCFECHSDHFGLTFEMIRFDEANFDHDLAGYKLEGKHKLIDCRECHISDYIENEDLKKRTNTYLGMGTTCLSCHDDYHQETLSSNDCTSCHDTEAFSPAPNFDHSNTDYPLKGKHELVDCKLCHEISSENGQEFQKFSDVPFNDCKVCHEDPHNEQIKGQCSQCHTENSFTSFNGKGNYNHLLTDFTLKGKHKKIDCFSCHEQTNDPKLVFQNVKNVKESNCIECHEDIHQGKLGNACVDCHNENSFTSLNSLDLFNHSQTDYTLEGMHENVDCKLCHENKYTKPIDFSMCKNCHEDYHLGEFVKNELSPDCVECHTVENGFDNSNFGLEEHQTSIFPLEGAHYATPCFACHISEDDERWTFKNIGEDCVDCHQNIHEDFINKKYYSDNNCQSCHVNESWSMVSFDHNSTSWPLEGEHLQINCRACHFVFSDQKNKFDQLFSNLESRCISCHQNIHGDQFAINGETDCKSCHSSISWFPEYFNHDDTAFKLDGRHLEIACTECHVAEIENESAGIIYKLEKYECIDCHL